MITGNKVLREIKYWGQILLLPIYAASHLIPRSKTIWAFGSTFGRRFADNPKYLYLFVSQYYSQFIAAVWITKNRKIAEFLHKRGYKAYYLYSITGIWYSLRSKVYIYDNYTKDICYTLSGGSVKINLWHGIPLKKIQKDNIFDEVRNPSTHRQKLRWILRRLTDEKPSHYVLTTSYNLVSIFSSAFRTQKVLTCGYPRNDILKSRLMPVVLSPEEEDFYSEIKCFQGKTILYMPTFRDSENRILKIIDLVSFQRELEKNQLLFCFKLHPKSRLAEKLKAEIGNGYHNIKVMEPEYDPYPFLKEIDCLVTDYSSVYFDYLLLDRKIIFFDYDLEDYKAHSREMYFDYKEVTPGPKVRTQEALINAIISEDIYQKQRKHLKEKMFNADDCCAGERLYKKINEIINQGWR